MGWNKAPVNILFVGTTTTRRAFGGKIIAGAVLARISKLVSLISALSIVLL